MIAHADAQKPPALSRTIVVPKPRRALKAGYRWVFEFPGTSRHGYRWVMVKGSASAGTAVGSVGGEINQADSGGFAG